VDLRADEEDDDVIVVPCSESPFVNQHEMPTNLVSAKFTILLRATYRSEPVGDPSQYRVGTPELAAWSMVHGAVMLWLDGQLGPSLDETSFLALADEMLADRLA